MARKLRTKPIVIEKWNFTNGIDYTDYILKTFDSLLQNYNTINDISINIYYALESSYGSYWLITNFLSSNFENAQMNFHYGHFDGQTMKYYSNFHHGNLGFNIFKF